MNLHRPDVLQSVAHELGRAGHHARAVFSRITQRSNSNFKFAFLFLPAHARAALGDVYHFCREADDIVDERVPGIAGVEQANLQLDEWMRDIATIFESGPDETDEKLSHNPLAARIAEHRRHFNLPREAFEEVLTGCRMDLELARYPDWPTLELYCYRVASCVGFLCLPIFGDDSDAARVYGRHLGLALQYTNILRDVAEDAARDRIYLPLSLLQKHGLSDDDILRNCYDARFIAAAAEFAAAAKREYDAAQAVLQNMDDRTALLPAQIMGQTYHAILEELIALQYNVHARRPSLRRRDKVRAAARALASVRLPASLVQTIDQWLGERR
jgi:phytoene synthase